MTAKAALCKALLDGRTLNIKNGFSLIGLTNIPREIGRSVIREFKVVIFKTPQQGKTRYGQTCNWVDYRLPKIKENEEGIKKMKAYVLSQSTEEDIELKYSRVKKYTEKPDIEVTWPETKYSQQNLF